MDDVLTIEEIHERFDSEWVLLEDPVTTKSLEIKAGRVLCHSKDRAEVWRRAVKLRPKRSAVIYAGRVPETTGFWL